MMENNENPALNEFLDEIRILRTKLEGLIAAVPADRREEASLPGGEWSVKDVLAHLGTWEELTVLRLQAALDGVPPVLPPLGSEAEMNAFNDRVHLEAQRRTFSDVHSQFDAAHHELMALLARQDEAFLASKLPEPWGRGRTAWQLVAANTIRHYPEHIEAIETWLLGS